MTLNLQQDLQQQQPLVLPPAQQHGTCSTATRRLIQHHTRAPLPPRCLFQPGLQSAVLQQQQLQQLQLLLCCHSDDTQCSSCKRNPQPPSSTRSCSQAALAASPEGAPANVALAQVFMTYGLCYEPLDLRWNAVARLVAAACAAAAVHDMVAAHEFVCHSLHDSHCTLIEHLTGVSSCRGE